MPSLPLFPWLSKISWPAKRKRPRRGLVVLFLLTLLLLFVPAPSWAQRTSAATPSPAHVGNLVTTPPVHNGVTTPPQATAQDYGSIAYSPSKMVVAAGYAGSPSVAAAAAVQQCRVKGGAADCWAVNWFYKAAGAFARASNPADDPFYAAGEGWADDTASAAMLAEEYAQQSCQQRGGKDCRVIFRAHTPTVSSAGTGGALTRSPAVPPTETLR